jgi:hypothetical protein
MTSLEMCELRTSERCQLFMPPGTADIYEEEDEDGIMRPRPVSCFECDPDFSEEQREEIRMSETAERAREAGRLDEAKRLDDVIFARWDAEWAAQPEHIRRDVEAALAKSPLVRHQD